MKKIFIDSDIYVRHARYPRNKDNLYKAELIEKILKGNLNATTSIFNLMEICGILSFNYSLEAIQEFYSTFPSWFNISILFPTEKTLGIIQYSTEQVFHHISKKKSFGDAQVSMVIEQYSPQLSKFITWNAKHFEGKVAT